MGANQTNEIADGAELNPEKQQLLRQLKAGECVLTKVRREKNDLQDANTKLGVELKDVRAQLLDSVKENQRLRRGIFSKCLSEPLKKRSSARKSTNKVMSVGVLTGRPAEEMPGSRVTFFPSSRNCSSEFGRRCKASPRPCCHPSPFPKLKGERQCFRVWKISAFHQGAREAWAMVKMRYTKADPNHMAEVGPVGPDGKEIPVSLVYGQVELAAKYSQ